MTSRTSQWAVAAAVAAFAAGAQAAPFANGSLESTAGGNIQTVSASTTANSWSVAVANVEYVKSGYSNGSDTVGAAQDGDWFVDLNGTQGPGRISQTFDTIAGQWYRIDYWISGNAGPNGSTMADGSKSLTASWNGGTADTQRSPNITRISGSAATAMPSSAENLPASPNARKREKG